MENLADYSFFVSASYAFAGAALTLLGIVVLVKYLMLKSKSKNGK